MKVFDLIAQYQSSYLTFKELEEELKSLFAKLLTLNNISFLQIESRIKSLPSFLDKVYRLISADKNIEYIFHDIVGIRLITYYSEDVDKITELIESFFKIHSKNSEYETHKRAPNQFGYSSIHYKISLSPETSRYPTLAKFKDIVFEVQVRTVAQHTWATIDHKIRYKTADEIPHDIQRQIFQLSALFELADRQFLDIKKKLEQQSRADLERYKQGDSTVKINALTLEWFFKTNQDIIRSIVDDAKRIGFKETTIQHDPNSIRYLLVLFQRVGIVNMGELEELFKTVRVKGAAIMENIYKIISSESIISIDYPFPVILLIIITIRLRLTTLNAIEFDDVIKELLGV